MNGPDFLGMRWYPIVNDLVGGWAVSSVDKPASKVIGRPESGEYFLGDFLTESIARHVCDLHNATLRKP